MPSRSFVRALLAGTAIATCPLLFVNTAQAQSVPSWVGGTSAYELASNWTPTGAPGPNSYVNFVGAGSSTIVVSGPTSAASWQFTASSQDYTVWGGDVSLTEGLINRGGNNSVLNNITAGSVSVEAGTLTLSGSSSFSGVSVSGGTLKAGSAVAIGSTAGLNTGGSTTIGTFDLNGYDITVAKLQGNANGRVTNNGSTAAVLTVGDATPDVYYSGTIADGASKLGLTKVGSGTLYLSGTNTYSGDTTVNAGVLRGWAANALSANSAVTLANTAGVALNLSNYTQTIASLSGGGANGGNVIMGSGALTTGGNDASTLYAGTISGGNGRLIKVGAGTMTLSGVNTYTGSTTINGGVLQAGATNTFAAASTVSLANTAGVALDLNGYSQVIGGLADGGATGGNVTLGSAALTVGGNDSSTSYAGAISGSGGSVIKTGTGTMTLTGNNTYTGGTTIQNGTLNLGSAGAIGTTGTITFGGLSENAGTLQYSAANQTDYSSRISTAANQLIKIDTNGQNVAFANGLTSAGGTLAKLGAGTLTTTGTNSLRLNIRGGTVALTGDAVITKDVYFSTSTTSLLDISQTNTGATIGGLSQIGGRGDVFLGSKTLTVNGNGLGNGFTGVISGSGGLTVTGSAVVMLNNANTYTGATTVYNGLSIRHDDAIAASSELNLAGSGAYASTSSSTSNVKIKTLRGVADSYISVYRDLTITNGSTSFSGEIGNQFFNVPGNLIIAGGRQSLDGTSSYTGNTTVNGGTLNVNGSIASSAMTTVNASGTLSGSGIVGNTTINGGTLAAGLGGGAMTVQGNLAFNAASTYLVDVSPAAAGRVNVTGTAALGGATVNANFAAGSYINKQYTILNAAGGVSGTFGSQVNTNLPSNFASSLSYDGKNAYLNLTLNYAPPPSPSAPTFDNSLPANQQGLANTLTNYFKTNGGIPLAFGALTPAGMTQVSGETTTGAQQTSVGAVTQFMGTMTDPLPADRGAPSIGAIGFAAEEDALAYAPDGRKRSRAERDAFAMFTKAPPKAYEARWNMWAAGFGGSQTTDGSAATGSNTSKSSIYGVAVGADYWFSPLTVAGVSMAGGGTNFSVTGGGSGRSDLLQVGAFIRHTIGSTYISAAAAYGWQDITTDRTVTVAGLDQLRAKFNTNSYSGRVEAGNRFVLPWVGGVGLTPYGAAQVTLFDLPSYAESVVAGSNTFALAYGGKTITATRTELGLRTDKSFALDDAILTLRGRAAWAHDFNTDRSASATFQSLPGASFVVNGAALASNAALTTASAELKCMNGWSIAGTFEGEFSDVTTSYAGKGLVRYAW